MLHVGNHLLADSKLLSKLCLCHLHEPAVESKIGSWSKLWFHFSEPISIMEINKIFIILDGKTFSEMILEESEILVRDSTSDCEIVNMGLIHDYQHNTPPPYKYRSRCTSMHMMIAQMTVVSILPEFAENRILRLHGTAFLYVHQKMGRYKLFLMPEFLGIL